MKTKSTAHARRPGVGTVPTFDARLASSQGCRIQGTATSDDVLPPVHSARHVVRAALARNLLAAELSRWSARTTTALLWGRSRHTRIGVLPSPGRTPRW